MIIYRKKRRAINLFCITLLTVMVNSFSLMTFAQNTPVAGDDENFTYQDFAVTGNVYDNDYDLDGDELTFSVVSGTADGTWDLQPNGDYTYTPNQYVIGVETLIYQACDEDGMCAEATLTMYVIFLNDAPQANDDAFNAELNTSRTFNVRLNDVEPDNEIMLFYAVAPPSHGTMSINVTTGVLTYTPTNGYTGPDSFTYQACDPCNVCNQASVDVMVLPANEPPVFSNVNLSANEDELLVGNLNAYVTDPENDNLTFGLITNSPNGIVTVMPNGEFTFMPNSNFNGLTSFFINSCDIVGQCTSAIASVIVAPMNDAPTADDDSFNATEDMTMTNVVGGNDNDIDNDLLTYSLVSNTTSGNITMQANGQFTYVPGSNANGSYSFIYQACDIENECAEALVTIALAAVNDFPIATDDQYTTSEDNVLNGTVANDTDIDSPTLLYSYVSGATNGSITINTDGSFTYFPNANWFGTENITYQVCDNSNACTNGNLQIIVTYINDAPTVNNESFTMDEDEALDGNVSANDNNQGEGSLSYEVASIVANGVLTLNNDGTFTYTPNTNWYGTEVIAYSGCNINNACDGGTLTITVNPINDAPICTNAPITLNEDETGSFFLTDLISDIDNTNLNFDFSGPTQGTIIPGDNESILYTPEFNYYGIDQILVEFCDTGGLCCTSTVNLEINPINDTPQTSDGEYVGIEDNTLIDMLPAANDIDGDDLTYELVTPPMNGEVSLQPNGNFQYIPYANSNGVDFFTFSVCDGYDACDAAIASVSILAINDQPVALDEVNGCPINLSINGDVSENDSDIETTNLTYQLVSHVGPGTIDFYADGTYTFVSATPGIAIISYTACDDLLACDQALLTIQISEVNTAPTAQAISLSMNEDTTYPISLIDYTSDNEGGDLTFTLLNTNEFVMTTLDENGQLEFTPDNNYYGVVNFDYEVCDNANLCAQSTIELVVLPINDRPQATSLEFVAYENSFLNGDLNSEIIDDGNEFIFSLLSTIGGVFEFNLTPEGSFYFEPLPYENGIYEVVYSVCDTEGLCDTINSLIYTININNVPIAEDVIISTDEEQDYSGTLIYNAIDFDLEALTFSAILEPLHGTITIDPNGEFFYSPDAEFSGFDSVMFSVCDIENACALATLNIEVVFMNDLPVAVDDFTMVLEDDDISGSVALNDVELDDEIDSYTVYTQPQHGVLVLNENGSYTYTPFENYYGLDQALYLMCDPCGACDIGILDFEVTFINDMPVVEDEQIFVYQNTFYEGSVALNDYELDIEELTYFVVDDNSGGLFELYDDGTFYYVPGDNELGIFTLEYMACDPCGACSYGMLTIEVGPLEEGNTAPIANDLSATVCASGTLTLDLAPYIFDLQDADGTLDIYPYMPMAGYAEINGTILTYVSDEQFPGLISIQYEACDLGVPSLCDVGFINVTVALNDYPIIDDIYVENVLCYGENSGYIEILSAASLGEVSYLWQDDSTDSLLTNLGAGEYLLTLSSDAPCSVPTNYSITVSGPTENIEVVADIIGITDESTGYIDLIITGGMEPYTVQWSGLSGLPDGTGLFDISSAGTYYATIEDANGCTMDTSFTLTGIQELENQWSLNCWPIPAADFLQISIQGCSGEKARLQIFDVAGRMITEHSLGVLGSSQIHRIDINALAVGQYQLHLVTSSGSKSLSFIKE